jgi:hypothetical protein
LFKVRDPDVEIVVAVDATVPVEIKLCAAATALTSNMSELAVLPVAVAVTEGADETAEVVAHVEVLASVPT